MTQPGPPWTHAGDSGEQLTCSEVFLLAHSPEDASVTVDRGDFLDSININIFKTNYRFSLSLTSVLNKHHHCFFSLPSTCQCACF